MFLIGQQGSARLGITHANGDDGVIDLARSEAAAIGGPAEGLDGPILETIAGHQLKGGRLPDLAGPIITARGQELPIGGPGHAIDPIGMAVRDLWVTLAHSCLDAGAQ